MPNSRLKFSESCHGGHTNRLPRNYHKKINIKHPRGKTTGVVFFNRSWITTLNQHLHKSAASISLNSFQNKAQEVTPLKALLTTAADNSNEFQIVILYLRLEWSIETSGNFYNMPTTASPRKKRLCTNSAKNPQCSPKSPNQTKPPLPLPHSLSPLFHSK